MSEQRTVLPNTADGFVVAEMRRRLDEGHTVRIAFGGSSMKPLIDGDTDIIHLEPLPPSLNVGDVYLFFFRGQCVIHRLLKVDGDTLIFRGDNCETTERIGRSDVMARLKAVEHADGSFVDCSSLLWRCRSRHVVCRRSFVNALRSLFPLRRRRWMRWVYFVALLVLMWAPMGFVGVQLDNFVLGIRFDHLLHASVYIPCTFSLCDFRVFRQRASRTGVALLLAAALIGTVTETVQYLLPYRGFDINDLVANFMGVTLGWLLLRLFKK